ncbi:MAG: hypothetical protein UY74_C0020G0002 [Candidatus Kaiserbacteria bacterium GW2011_GWC2_52_8b]|uniref:Uncharacterized protein n=2 Tax=Candidatus Kaiseribacteriota TaxID=1752734 RepID=A0A0G1XK31_9BACT|nr:MAG: hypothetical protein UY67_C0024G0001 [Candidatus Kaiserbacteria bacterium GW2011_GWA2_52_12]KKW31225.1 MAG: hypothetical protein UY74_C0020G0002 [Candidatus Kaiserbacteria bacterium GW2011_GWC2_52_8b]
MESFKLHRPQKGDNEEYSKRKALQKSGRIDTSFQNNVDSLGAIVLWIVVSYLIGIVWGSIITFSILAIRLLVRKSK